MATVMVTAMATATATALATAMAPAAAMARAVAMLLLKMDENVNLRLERHVNRALCYYLWLSSWHKFVYFSKYWVASDRKRKGHKSSQFQACHRYSIYKT